MRRRSLRGKPDRAAGGISDAERELYGGRLRWDTSFVRHEGALTRMGFGRMAAALPRTAGMVLRTGWAADRRALAGVVTAQLGQGVTAAWGLVAVNSVLTRLFSDGPTADKLREALPALAVLAVVSVGAAVLAAWSTAMSGRLEPQVERAVSARYYEAVTRVEVEATERPEVQRVLEAGKFGTDSARTMLRLSVGVGNVLISMVAAAVVLASLHWLLLPMLLAIALPKGWGAVRSAHREYTSRINWVDHRRAVASLLAYLTRPHAAGEIRAHAAGTQANPHGAVPHIVGVHLYLENGDGRVLLGLRHPDSAYAPATHHFLAGHCEQESALACLAREAQEEAGLRIDTGDVELAHLVHLVDTPGGQPRIGMVFRAHSWSGTPEVLEPDKCTAWDWWHPDDLPAQIVPYTRAAIEGIRDGRLYTELGWTP